MKRIVIAIVLFVCFGYAHAQGTIDVRNGLYIPTSGNRNVTCKVTHAVIIKNGYDCETGSVFEIK